MVIALSRISLILDHYENNCIEFKSTQKSFKISILRYVKDCYQLMDQQWKSGPSMIK